MNDSQDWYTTDLQSVVFTIESGSRPKGGVSTETGDIPSLGGENILRSGGVSTDGVRRVPRVFFERMTKGHLHNKDVLINKDGAQTGKVGIYSGSEDACINEHLFLVRGKPEKIRQDFLFYALLSEVGQRQIASQISGSAQPGLKSNFLSGVVAKIPKSLCEQRKVAEILIAVDRAIEQTEALIAKQQRIQAGLMHDLLTRGIDEEGRIRSEKTHEFRDSELGRIPAEWDVKTLEQLTHRIVDGVHHTPSYVDSGVHFIVITDLTRGKGIDFSDTRFVTPQDHAEFSKRVAPRPGDVLVTKDGTLGVARIVPPHAPEFSIFVSVALLRPKIDLCISELIWTFFESGEFLIQLGAQSAGTGLSHIHLEHFRAFRLRRPPVEEQNRILRIIVEQQDAIDDTIADLKKLQSLKAALMQDLLTGRKSVAPLLGRGAEQEVVYAAD